MSPTIGAKAASPASEDVLYLARYGREVNNDEVEFARVYDEHRLYAYIDGGGTFDGVEVVLAQSSRLFKVVLLG
ncbi:hypothetical protein R1sor_026097 [Riccia sorocarpa]|uniref:Uncharacterized protein n=1 Tax=Riccia sorocarpa TaxID=122646 RepID=A0ABD3GEG3_9MARC